MVDVFYCVLVGLLHAGVPSVVSYKIAEDGNYGVVVEVNSETDFVARDEN